MGELVAILRAVGLWLLRLLPGWVLAWRFKPKELADAFAVELMSPTSLNIQLDATDDPRVYLYLRFVNLTPLKFQVERIQAEIRVAQRNLCKIVSHDRYEVLPSSAVPPFRYGFAGMHDPKVFLEHELDIGRVQGLKSHLKMNPGGDVEMLLWIDGTCQTGRFERGPLEIRMPLASAGITP